MSISRVWEIEMIARSQISHQGETIGGTALFRHMKIIQPDGAIELVPVVSGNSFRGVLRRIREMLREVLGYDNQLPLPVAHTLRNGGSIVKTKAEPVTGRRLNELRELVPLHSVFGGAVGAAPISGCLRVGHVVPAPPKPHRCCASTTKARCRAASTSKPAKATATSTT